MSAHRALRSRHHGAPTVELGLEPPLGVVGADPADPIDRRAVSIRWLAGTVLTGMAGAALLGGACYSTTQGGAEITQALRMASAQARTDDRVSNGARKGDRLTPDQETSSSRQTIRVSTTTKHGDREVVRMRPYVRVGAPLARAPTEFASRVPPFDPLKTIAAAARDRAGQDEPEGEGDLSFTVGDLARAEIPADEGPVVPPVEVRARVREAAAFEFATRVEPTVAIEPGAQAALAYASGAGELNAGVLDIRPMVRNMTLVAKSDAAPGAATAPGESSIVVTAGGPLAGALERDAGVEPEDARIVADRFAGRDGYGVASVMAGQRLKVLMGRAAGAGGRLQPVRVSLFDADGGHIGSVALSDIGDYVAVADVADFADEPSPEEIADEVARPGTPGRMRLYNGLYEAALRNQVPAGVVNEMVRIVSYDVDFNRPVGAGDSFEVFFADPAESGGDGEVAYMALKLSGEQRRFYRFETDDDNYVDFYDETGKSAKKFLMRKPMNGGVMRSGFGFRRHPILGYSKMHTGVDWAAPTGTPIVASGNGSVEKAGWASGYGRQVVLKHANGYETTYNHMSGIARGVSAGAQVRQGQVVGYVGSTGLSTGAHLHYEVMINGRFVNPMTVKLPRGRELDGSELAKFQKERGRIDGLLGRGPATAQKAGDAPGG